LGRLEKTYKTVPELLRKRRFNGARWIGFGEVTRKLYAMGYRL